MSYITSVMLFIGGLEEEEERLKEVNVFFQSRGTTGLVAVTNKKSTEDKLGGNKVFVDGLYLGAYNYFSLKLFEEHLNCIHWEHPEQIQLFVLTENDLTFHIVELNSKTNA